MLAHGGDAQGDVLVEGNAELFGAFYYILAVDAAGEGFVFHAFFDRADLEVENAFRRPDIGTSGEEAGEFVAGKEGVLELGLAGNVAVIGVGEDGADRFFTVPVLPEDFGAFGGVFAVGGMVVVGPALVVEVVKQGSEAPGALVFAELAGIGADAGFDGEHVLAKAFGLCVLTEEIPGIVACRHGAGLQKGTDRILQEGEGAETGIAGVGK